MRFSAELPPAVYLRGRSLEKMRLHLAPFRSHRMNPQTVCILMRSHVNWQTHIKIQS